MPQMFMKFSLDTVSVCRWPNCSPAGPATRRRLCCAGRPACQRIWSSTRPTGSSPSTGWPCSARPSATSTLTPFSSTSPSGPCTLGSKKIGVEIYAPMLRIYRSLGAGFKFSMCPPTLMRIWKWIRFLV